MSSKKYALPKGKKSLDDLLGEQDDKIGFESYQCLGLKTIMLNSKGVNTRKIRLRPKKKKSLRRGIA